MHMTINIYLYAYEYSSVHVHVLRSHSKYCAFAFLICLFTVFLLRCPACLCRVERSTDQVMKPVNRDALSKWVGQIPADVISEMAEIAPMLARLGYDPQENPPDYTKAESMLSPSNSLEVSQAIVQGLF